MLKSFLTSLFSFIVLDFIWLGYVMKTFNLQQLAEIGRITNGDFQVWYAPAIATYLLMALAVQCFVLPACAGKSLLRTFGSGALMGLIIYGIYDATNLAILKNYPLSFAIPDVAWGTFVFGAVTALSAKLRNELTATDGSR